MNAVISDNANNYEYFAQLCRMVINQPKAVVQSTVQASFLPVELMVKM